MGRDLAYGREFGFCETAGAKLEDEQKIIDNTLKAKKISRDMFCDLVLSIQESGGRMHHKRCSASRERLADTLYDIIKVFCSRFCQRLLWSWHPFVRHYI